VRIAFKLGISVACSCPVVTTFFFFFGCFRGMEVRFGVRVCTSLDKRKIRLQSLSGAKWEENISEKGNLCSLEEYCVV